MPAESIHTGRRPRVAGAPPVRWYTPQKWLDAVDEVLGLRGYGGPQRCPRGGVSRGNLVPPADHT